MREVRKTRGGALLDTDDAIRTVLDDNDFVSVGRYEARHNEMVKLRKEVAGSHIKKRYEDGKTISERAAQRTRRKQRERKRA